MLHGPEILLAALLVVALTFDFMNGFQDSATVVATLVASHAMSLRGALALAAAANFAGPFVLGVAVAQTVGAEMARPEAIDIGVVLAALVSAAAWDLVAWRFGMPVSSSHALFGGILGGAVAAAGPGAVQLQGVAKVAAALLLSPFAGFLLAFLVMKATRWTLRDATPRAAISLSRLQIVTGAALALSHGGNDAQKTMGVISLGLLMLGFTQRFVVPAWVIAASASAIGLGTALGGRRIMRTLGAGFYRVRTIHGFSAQVASAAAIFGASLAGGPVSTTQVVGGSILGAGVAERMSMVRWSLLGEVAAAWLLTLPVTALAAGPLYWLIETLLHAANLGRLR